MTSSVLKQIKLKNQLNTVEQAKKQQQQQATVKRITFFEYTRQNKFKAFLLIFFIVSFTPQLLPPDQQRPQILARNRLKQIK